MIKSQDSLPSYLEEKYGVPANDEEAVYFLQEIFKEQLKKSFLTMSDKEGLEEQYNLLMSRNLPAFKWIAEAIHIVSKKEEGKQNLRYIVGMMRHWMKWGYGHIPSEEEDELTDYFEEVTQLEMSPQARSVMKTLMGEYGGIKIARMMPKLKEEEDFSLILMQRLSLILNNKYNN